MKTENTMNRSTIGIVLATALILSLPLLAMQFTDEVVWDLADFVVAGALLLGTGLMYQLGAKKAGSTPYRVGVGVALAAALLLVWINLAVGIIGSEDNLANAMYLGVLAVGFIGAVIARFQPYGMSRALFATALAQALVGAIAIVGGMGAPWSGALELTALNGFFVAMWVGSGWLFREAARRGPDEVPTKRSGR